MNETKLFLRDIDDAISRGSAESRLRALRHTTDLMIAGGYSDDEIWTFGEVIGRLADEIEVVARAQLAKRLAEFDRAPVNIIHKLAFDDAIEVAGPVLRDSKRLEPYALVANACLKSQTHLLAISKRTSIDESVTDVLVTRGNEDVVNSVATNNGARFSDFGFLHMVKRAEGDSILAEQLGLRKDIPRQVFQQLIAKASWDTTMALLFLGAKDHRITALDLKDLESEFGRLNVETSRSILEFYQSRKHAAAADSDVKRQPALLGQ